MREIIDGKTQNGLGIALIVLALLISTSAIFAASSTTATVCDNAGDPCGLESPPCGNQSDGSSCSSCGSDSDDGPDDGDTCYTDYNACGVRTQGVYCDGVCSTRTQTGTNSKGQPVYSCTPLSPPSLPANYGAICESGQNACGETTTGTIGCNGTCSASTPSLPAGYGNSCTSAANACGETATGTIGCNGCSASAPALPAGYGTSCSSPANACGEVNTGSIGCSGQCSVSTTEAPALPDGYGESCQSAPNVCGMRNTGVIQCSGQCSASTPSDNLCAADVTIDIRATPRIVQHNSTTNISWSTTDADTCTVVGTNGDSWSGITGNRTTTALTDTTIYSISCVGINTEVVVGSVTVNIVPVFQEF